MGSFGESKQKTQENTKQKVNTTTATDPWGPQAGYLKDIFGSAQDLYDDRADPYSGDHLASFRPEQIDMFGKMIGYANTSPIAAMLAGQGGNLSSIGQGALSQGIGGLGGFNPLDMQGIIDAGNKFAENPYISNMVDAATRDDYRNLTEQQLPGVARGAALSGNTNSSRTGAREAILERGYQDRRADVSAALQNQAFGTGVDAAQQGRDAEMARLMGLTGTGLQAAGTGANALNDSVAAMRELFGLGTQGAQGLQDADQQELSNALAKYSFEQDSAWAPLMNYFNIIGQSNWGGTEHTKGKTTGTATGTTTNQASPAAVAGGLITSLGSLIPGK